MSGPQLRDLAILLRQRPSGEKFTSLCFLSEQHGLLHTLARNSQKPNSSSLPDLYDEGLLEFESAKLGSSFFFKGFDSRQQRRGIARSYDSLAAAASLSQLFIHNPIHEENGPDHFQLAKRCLDALSRNIAPNAVVIKGLYLFSRYEGYPIKQEWFDSLAKSDAAIASRILNQPLDNIVEDKSAIQSTLGSIRNYIESYTEIHLD